MANYRVRLSDGVTLACRSEGAGPPFVWSHGMLVNTALEEAIGFLDWRALAAEHRVVRYDVRGHGASDGTGRAADHEWPRLAEDLLQVLNHLGLDRVAVGGDSMGCAISLHLAAVAPERVGAVVLCIPPSAWTERTAIARLYGALATVVASPAGLPLAALRLLPLGAVGEPARRPALAVSALAHMRRSDLVAILRGASHSDLPDPAVIRSIDVPALVLAWRGDRVHPAVTAERLAELLPDTELSVAPRPSRTQPWTARVLSFLGRTSTSGGP